MASDKVRLTVEISGGSVDLWREIAAELDIRADRGTYAGQGSISGLMGAIAARDVEPARLDQAIQAVRARRSQLAMFPDLDAEKADTRARPS